MPEEFDLENAWKKINSGSQVEKIDPTEFRPVERPMAAPLVKIKKNIAINIAWAIVICMLYVALLVVIDLVFVQILILLLLGFSVWAIWDAYKVYKVIQPDISAERNLLQELERHYQLIHQWIVSQQKVGLFFYPISVVAGFLLGAASGSGKSILLLLTKPIILISLGISLAVFVPACYFLVKWMVRFSFGKYLDQIGEYIETLKSEE